MKILQICNQYFPEIGGVETCVQEISKRLKYDHSVRIITTDPTGNLPNNDRIDGIPVIRFRSIAPQNAYYLSIPLLLSAKYLKAEIIHLHNYHALPASLVINQVKAKKIVFSPYFHGSGHTFIRKFLHIPYRLYAKKLFKISDIILCNSDYEKELIRKKFQISRCKMIVIPLGVKNEFFYDRMKPKSHKNLNLLYVGRLEKYKGIQHILNALKEPIITEVNPRLYIVGKGPYTNSIIKKINENRLNDYVKIDNTTSGSDLIKYYRNCDVFISLSSKESFGLTVAESLAAGMSAVVSDTGALSDFIDNKKCFGINISSNSNELARKILLSYYSNSDYNKPILSWDKYYTQMMEKSIYSC